MSRYIKLADALRTLADSCYLDEIDNNMQRLPSIDLADYVPKDFHDKTCEAMAKRHTEEIERLMPKRGEWIWDNDAVDWNLGAWICSNCHARNDNIPHSERTIPLRWSGSKFCPNCGADMREREGE